MPNGIFNLNEPPGTEEDRLQPLLRFVMLTKDNKPICRTNSFHLPFEAVLENVVEFLENGANYQNYVSLPFSMPGIISHNPASHTQLATQCFPNVWAIIKYKPSKIYLHLDLPQCQLYPAPENTHQKREWGLFMSYLRKRQSVAVVNSECCEFYILAPDGCSEFSYAIVMYKTREQMQKHSKQEFGTSGRVSPVNARFYDSTHCSREKFGDNGDSNAKATNYIQRGRVSSHAGNNLCSSNPHMAYADHFQEKNANNGYSNAKDANAKHDRHKGTILSRGGNSFHNLKPHESSINHFREQIGNNGCPNGKDAKATNGKVSSHAEDGFCTSKARQTPTDSFREETRDYGCLNDKDVKATNDLSRREVSSYAGDSMHTKKPPQPSVDICLEGTNDNECSDGIDVKDSSHAGNTCHISKPRQASMDRSACESIEDASQPVSMTKDLPKNFVRTDPSYLRTLSQTHAGWIFGAIAELVDNSRDANATRLDIFMECLYSKKAGKKVPVLSIIDDGRGMSHIEIMRMLSFGHKQPDKEDPDRIGRFGIGFKTGAMRLGRDALVLTQTSSSRSVALLSQSFNRNKEILEIPMVTYCKQGLFMEVDLNIQSEAQASSNLNAIKGFSPFNEYLIGEKLGLFGEMGTGTQVYIWNLDQWGSDYSLEWSNEKNADNTPHQSCQDILIRSRRVRSRPGQITQKVPLDYSLQAYLEVIFLNPRMKIYVQGSLVKSRPLAKSLNKTAQISGQIMGRSIQLTLGRSKVEWERMNCGIFLYWHGRLIEAYKRVGEQIHNADVGRGVVGVCDVTNLMDCENGDVFVLNNKQGFQDCEVYAKLEEWLGAKANDYWDKNFDTLDVRKGDQRYKPDHDWVQCNKCCKWRILDTGFNSESLPSEWFCYMPPFQGRCEIPEQQVAPGVITIGAKRSGHDIEQNTTQMEEGKSENTFEVWQNRAKKSASRTIGRAEIISSGAIEDDSSQTKYNNFRPILKRFRSGSRINRHS